jgi:phosphoserine phosphatase
LTETSIPEALRQLADTGRTGAALFDADGVLWHGDVSEDFTRWMVEEGHFDEALWPRYQEAHARDPARGCFEILSFYVGMSKTDIRDCVERFWRTGPERRWLECTMATLRWVVEIGFSVYTVSGTPSLVLEPLPTHLPVEMDGILALEIEFDSDGLATGRSTGIPTVGAGKAQRVSAEIKAPVLLAVGNSSLDIEMLQLSERLAWAINPDPALRAAAEREGWLIT